MKKATKRLVFLLAFCLLFGTFASCKEKSDLPEGTSEVTTERQYGQRPQAKEDKTIDIYLIAGQSNAAGSSPITDTAAAYEFAPELETGYSNVLFTGRASDSIYSGWEKTKLGYGTRKDEQFGPEAGMAEALSICYNQDSGETAGLLKYACGGVNLLNDTTSNASKKYGNWVPPSYAEAKGYSYDADEITGKLYRGFLESVKTQLSVLKYKGFSSFRIKGLYWMQGENDRSSPQAYREAFGYLVEDLRHDLAEIAKELSGGDDCGAADMPIWVGTISRTFESAADAQKKINAAFINMQKELADEQNKIFVVDNSIYDINRMVSGRSEPLGNDCWHWDQTAQLYIGYNVGIEMLKYYYPDLT